jgi:hypothetical protein
MVTTVNFTAAVDRDLLQRAKVVAAKLGTSINALFNAELRYLLDTFEAAEDAGNQNYKTLLAFSLGRTTTSRQCRPWASTTGKTCFFSWRKHTCQCPVSQSR